MADLSTLARPYAKAVFQLARDIGKLAEWGEALEQLSAAVQSPQIASLIGHPAVNKAELASVLGAAAGEGTGAQGASLVKLLVENKRVQVAPFIAEQFEAMRAEAEARVDVEITTAAETSPRDQEQLADAIAKRLQRDVEVSWKTDETLIAGALIRAGDLVIDGSARGELEKLRTALAN